MFTRLDMWRKWGWHALAFNYAGWVIHMRKEIEMLTTAERREYDELRMELRDLRTRIQAASRRKRLLEQRARYRAQVSRPCEVAMAAH